MPPRRNQRPPPVVPQQPIAAQPIATPAATPVVSPTATPIATPSPPRMETPGNYVFTGTVDPALSDAQAAALKLRLSWGLGTDGQQLPAGTHTISGLTVVIPPRTARPPPSALSVRFVSGKRGRSLPDDEFTKRSTGGKIKPLTTADVIPMSSAVKATMDDTGNILARDAAQKQSLEELIKALSDINGQDAYSNETQALGRLNPNEFLILPADMPTPRVSAELVGSGEAIDKFSTAYVLAVYALNKPICKEPRDAVKFATVRMEAVKWGWVDAQREIMYKPIPADYLEICQADKTEIEKVLCEAAKVAWLVPLAAEHVFRTAGHHYLTNMDTAYTDRYSQIFKACLEPALDKFMPPSILFHQALHWVSPERVWAVLQASKDDARVPEAIRMRMTAAPAGAAIITTPIAIFNTMTGLDITRRFHERNVVNIDLMIDIAKKIKANPVKYHKVHQAYGLAALSETEKSEFETAKEEGQKIAPVCKAYVDVMLKRSAMAKQKVLDKPASNNPMIYAQAKKLFIALAKSTPENIDALFNATVAAINPS